MQGIGLDWETFGEEEGRKEGWRNDLMVDECFVSQVHSV